MGQAGGAKLATSPRSILSSQHAPNSALKIIESKAESNQLITSVLVTNATNITLKMLTTNTFARQS